MEPDEEKAEFEEKDIETEEEDIEIEKDAEPEDKDFDIEEQDFQPEDKDFETDQKLGLCEECGALGVVRNVQDRVLCEACADLIEDIPKEEPEIE